MIKNITWSVLIAILAITWSCSKDGETPKSTYDAKASFSFTQTDVWPQRYKIILGAYDKDTLNPLVYSEITKQTENTSVAVSLEKVPEEGTTIRLNIANQSNQSVYTLFSYKISESAAIIEIPENQIKLLSFNRVQVQTFNNCMACHGASSGLPAAGLNLMPEMSYANLVNQVAQHSTKMRVEPENANNSFLIDVLRKKQNIFTHSASNTIAEEDIILIERWIETGATIH